MSAFLRPVDFYTRDSDFISNYARQMATGLSIRYGITVEQALEKIRQWKKEGRLTMENPIVGYFTKNSVGDRIHETTTLTAYIKDTISNKEIIVPTFTCYQNHTVEESPIAGYVDFNVKRRSVNKKASQKAKAEGNLDVAFNKDCEQRNNKENNNSLSGLFAAEASIFQNDTGHNTLTSITRSMASIANALNERIIGGNRHYRDIHVALNNSFALIESSDMQQVQEVLETFNLRAPTVQELMEVYRHSMENYIYDNQVYKTLLPIVEKMNGLQRAIVAYSQDLYHLKKFNRETIFKLLEDFTRRDIIERFEDPIKFIHSQDELTVSFAHQVCLKEVQGKGKAYEKMSPETVQLVANVCKHIEAAIKKYRLFFETFFLTKTVPCSTAFIQDMRRNTCVLSDTDSTIFSVDQWVLDYFGKLDFSSKGFAIAGAVAFIASQVNAHCLGVLSGNMGVSKDKIHELQMKPEFVFPVFVQSPVAKHYFTAKLVCEGNVYAELEMEIKGVHNRNSALPDEVNKETHTRMENLIKEVMDGKQIRINEEIGDLIRIENEIRESLLKGELTYLKRVSIKTPSSYSVKDPVKNSIYCYHTLWQQVFAPKYGALPEPEYSVVKIPLTTDSAKKLKSWVQSFQDKAMAARFEQWIEDHGKNAMKTFYLSADHASAFGLPEELIPVFNLDRIILDITMARRMLLDSLGFSLKPETLVSTMVSLPPKDLRYVHG